MNVPDAVRRDLYEALAGAVLARDELAALHSSNTVVALHAVDALNRVLATLGLPSPNGTARMVRHDDRPPTPGWVDDQYAS